MLKREVGFDEVCWKVQDEETLVLCEFSWCREQREKLV
jgi:hypothetical protein